MCRFANSLKLLSPHLVSLFDIHLMSDLSVFFLSTCFESTLSGCHDLGQSRKE